MVITMRFIDISCDALTANVYPGDRKPVIEIMKNMADGDDYNLSAVSMSSHCGTHMDAPLHFISDGNPIDKLDISSFIGECIVISANGLITGEWVDKNVDESTQRLIINGDENTFLMANAAYELAQTNVKLVGINQMSIGCEGSESEVHTALLNENIAIVESLNLCGVSDGKYFLVAPPLKFVGAEAAPVRAILIDDYIFWSK